MNSVLGKPESNGQKQLVSLRNTPVPLQWLMATNEDTPSSTIITSEQSRQTQRDLNWSKRREQLFAAAAAGFHLTLFAYNLAFWGMEGMPQNRYQPSSLKLKLQVKPMRVGNMVGSRRVYFDYLNRIEGA